MKRLLIVLSWLLLLVVSEASFAAVLVPVGVSTTSYWSTPGDGDPVNMIDGSGLSASGPIPTRTHDNSVDAATMWHAGDAVGTLGGPSGIPPVVAAQAVVFDLGTLVDLGGAYVWNHNQLGVTGRGVNQLAILVSADADPLTATFTNLGNFSFAQAGGGTAQSAQLVPFTASQVRLVKFDISTAHSGLAADFVGLAEVRFAPPLATIDSDADGLDDAFELAHGFDPLDPDENGNARVDGQDDADMDGLGNAAEALAGTDPNDPDSDADGLLDGSELGQAAFAPPAQVITDVASGVVSAVAADFDGDGDLDVLAAEAASGHVAWYENTNGEGSFGAEQILSATAPVVTQVFAADLDGDGDLDALSASVNDDTIAWFENTDGAGSFGPEQVLSSTANGASSVFAADLDGDGDLDVAFAARIDDRVGWFENTNGAGAFGPAQTISSTSDGATTVFVADVDGDGDADVIAGSRVADTVVWFPNTNGAGSFGPAQLISASADFVQSVHAADLDGDGDVDVLSASSLDNTVSWFENVTGAGAFGPEQLLSTTAIGAGFVSAADVDGDGDLDVLSASAGNDTFAWFENTDGAGSFAAAQPVSTTANSAASITAADLDGDGDLDLLGASSLDDTIAWFENPSLADPLDPDSDDDGLDDGFEVAHAFEPLDPDDDANGRVDGQDDTDADGLGNAAEQRAGTDPRDEDSDDDGLLDGAELGQGSFGSQRVITTAADFAEFVLAADLDGDGDVDVIATSSSDDTLSWYRNLDGAGTFSSELVISTSGDYPISVSAADLDGDGDLDLVLASTNDDTVAWYENLNGLGAFSGERIISSTANGAWSVAAADLDGDGDADVVQVSRFDGTIAWHENLDGAGSFGTAQPLSTSIGSPRKVLAADLDGDGDFDVLYAADSGVIGWFENLDGTDGFGPSQSISTTVASARGVFAADLDGDGDLDVLSASGLLSAVGADVKIAWHENLDGAGTFGSNQPITSDILLATSVAAADLDGDGDLDVLYTSANDSIIAWQANTDGDGTFGSQQIITTAAAVPFSVVAADLDGDGDFDAVSASGVDDKVAWYENENVADPLDEDTDDDGLLDGFEVIHAFDPLVADEEPNGVLDGLDDADGDGLINQDEQTAGTSPRVADTDGDGFDDPVEIAAGTNPLDEFDFPGSPPTVPVGGPWTGWILLVGLLLVGLQGRRGLSTSHGG